MTNAWLKTGMLLVTLASLSGCAASAEEIEGEDEETLSETNETSTSDEDSLHFNPIRMTEDPVRCVDGWYNASRFTWQCVKWCQDGGGCWTLD